MTPNGRRSGRGPHGCVRTSELWRPSYRGRAEYPRLSGRCRRPPPITESPEPPCRRARSGPAGAWRRGERPPRRRACCVGRRAARSWATYASMNPGGALWSRGGRARAAPAMNQVVLERRRAGDRYGCPDHQPEETKLHAGLSRHARTAYPTSEKTGKSTAHVRAMMAITSSGESR